MKISRRKYDVLVKFLREVIASSKNERIRYAAAERLDGIYARHEMYEQQALRRKERQEARALAAQGQGATVAHQELLGPDGVSNYNDVVNALVTPATGGSLAEWVSKLPLHVGELAKAPVSGIADKLLFNPKAGQTALTLWRQAGKGAGKAVFNNTSVQPCRLKLKGSTKSPVDPLTLHPSPTPSQNTLKCLHQSPHALVLRL
jgi:hypothetical protein